MFAFVELFAHDADFIARRESWDDGVVVYGLPRRTIKNKDIESTLLRDERVRHFVKGKDLTVGACLKIWDGETERDYFPNHADLFAGDWVLENMTELIKHKRMQLEE